jgi:methylthioribose-1-phosphate isomerase
MNTAQKWRKKNRKRINEMQVIRHRKLYKSSVEFKLAALTSARITKSLGSRKAPRYYTTLEYLGCTLKQFKKHIRKQFKKGMSWKKWNFQLDHIRPITSFNLFNAIEQKKAYNYKNVQPLSVSAHIEKTAKYIMNIEQRNRRLKYINKQYKGVIRCRT